MELTKELQSKVNEMVDARIAELFESGILKVNLNKNVTSYYSDADEVLYSISVSMNGKVLFETVETEISKTNY